MKKPKIDNLNLQGLSSPHIGEVANSIPIEFEERRSAIQLLEEALVEIRFGRRLSSFSDAEKNNAIEEAKQVFLVEFLQTANEKERAYVVSRIIGKPSEGRNLKEELKEDKGAERTLEDEQNLFEED